MLLTFWNPYWARNIKLRKNIEELLLFFVGFCPKSIVKWWGSKLGTLAIVSIWLLCLIALKELSWFSSYLFIYFLILVKQYVYLWVFLFVCLFNLSTFCFPLFSYLKYIIHFCKCKSTNVVIWNFFIGVERCWSLCMYGECRCSIISNTVEGIFQSLTPLLHRRQLCLNLCGLRLLS